MLSIIQGDLFSSPAHTLVNTVNCAGVMGKGIALEFKKRYPAMFGDYRGRCLRHEVKLGEPYLYKETDTRWILNFPTKDHWRNKSRMESVTAGLEYLAARYQAWGIRALAFPLLGANHGGLDPRLVQDTMARLLEPFVIPVELYVKHKSMA